MRSSDRFTPLVRLRAAEPCGVQLQARLPLGAASAAVAAVAAVVDAGPAAEAVTA